MLRSCRWPEHVFMISAWTYCLRGGCDHDDNPRRPARDHHGITLASSWPAVAEFLL